MNLLRKYRQTDSTWTNSAAAIRYLQALHLQTLVDDDENVLHSEATADTCQYRYFSGIPAPRGMDCPIWISNRRLHSAIYPSAFCHADNGVVYNACCTLALLLTAPMSRFRRCTGKTLVLRKDKVTQWLMSATDIGPEFRDQLLSIGWLTGAETGIDKSCYRNMWKKFYEDAKKQL